MKLTGSNYIAILLTLAVAGVVAFWAWYGLKSPPVHQPTVSIVTTPSGWKQFEAGPFNFYAPKYAVLRKLQDPDHAVGMLIGAGLYVRYEFGVYANTLADQADGTDYSQTETQIDGRTAILHKVTLNDRSQENRFGAYAQPSYIGLYIPQAVRHTGPDGKVQWSALQIEGVAVNGDLRDTVEIILKSIRFGPPKQTQSTSH